MGSVESRKVVPRPFLKWAGGKGQLLPVLLREVDRAAPFGRYHEPFLGGGALFLEMYRTGRLPEAPSAISDTNERLVETYRAVRDDVERVVELLREHAARHSREHYYAVRGCVPEGSAERAARIIYLNRTCFNGLYRENSKGLFNVPMGRYANPKICDEGNLRAVSRALEPTQLAVRPFEEVLDEAVAGDFVYFDPPYVPVSKTASFTKYDKDDFGEREQERLAEVFAALDRKGVKVMLSNSDTPLVRRLYGGFAVRTVAATRRVNSRADRRGEVREALVGNFG